MTAACAADIVTRAYPAPYQCYDMTSADPGFLVTVASFNIRALRVLRAPGFEAVTSFRPATDGQRFQILVRPDQAAG